MLGPLLWGRRDDGKVEAPAFAERIQPAIGRLSSTRLNPVPSTAHGATMSPTVWLPKKS